MCGKKLSMPSDNSRLDRLVPCVLLTSHQSSKLGGRPDYLRLNLPNFWVFRCVLCKTGSKDGGTLAGRRSRSLRLPGNVLMCSVRFLDRELAMSGER